MILFDPPTARDLLDGLRLLEGRRRAEGRALAKGALEVRALAEQSLAVRSGQSAPRGDEVPDDDGVYLLTVPDVMARLKASEATVRRAIASGDLKTVKLGRSCRFRVEDVEAYIASKLTERESA